MSDARIAKIRELQKLNEELRAQISSWEEAYKLSVDNGNKAWGTVSEMQAQVALLKSEKDELFGQGIKLIHELNKEKDLCYEHFFRWFALDKNISNILAAFRDTENSEVRELCEKIKTSQGEKNEASERVNKLVEVERAAREYVSVSNLKMSMWLGSSASLQEEKLNKLVALSKALDAIETEAR